MNYREIIDRYLQLQGHKALQLRAVLFDMDGVLFDSMPFHAKAWSQVMTDAGFHFTQEDVYTQQQLLKLALMFLILQLWLLKMLKDLVCLNYISLEVGLVEMINNHIVF